MPQLWFWALDVWCCRCSWSFFQTASEETAELCVLVVVSHFFLFLSCLSGVVPSSRWSCRCCCSAGRRTCVPVSLWSPLAARSPCRTPSPLASSAPHREEARSLACRTRTWTTSRRTPSSTWVTRLKLTDGQTGPESERSEKQHVVLMTLSSLAPWSLQILQSCKKQKHKLFTCSHLIMCLRCLVEFTLTSPKPDCSEFSVLICRLTEYEKWQRNDEQ